METRGATLCSDWPGEDQRLPTTRDQPPKQEHLPLTLHCKCSRTERTHTASSKPQPGVRKAIAHCAPTLSTDTLHYRESAFRKAVARKANLYQAEGHTHKHSACKESQPPITEAFPLKSIANQGQPKEQDSVDFAHSKRTSDQAVGALPEPVPTERQILISSESLSQVAGKAGTKKEPFPSPTPTTGQRRTAVREDHWRYTENPSSLVLSRLPGSGKPLRSFEKTVIPTA